MSESFAKSLRESSAAPPPSALRAGGKKRKSVRFSEDECGENDASAASSSNADAAAARNAEKGICLSGAPPRQRQALSNTSNVQAPAPGMQNCADSKADAANQQARSKNRGIGGGAVRIRTPSKAKRPRVEEHHYYQAPQPLQLIAQTQQQTSSAAAAPAPYMAASAAALTSALRAGSTPAPVPAARPVLPLSAPALTLSAMPSTPLSQRRLLGPAGLGGVSAFSRAASALATVAESPHSESLPEDSTLHSNDSSTSATAPTNNSLQLAVQQQQQQQQPTVVDSALVEQLRATLAAVGEQGRCLSAMVTDLQAGAVVPRGADVSDHASLASSNSTVRAAASGGAVCTCGGTKAVGTTVGTTIEDEHSPLRERLEELQSKVTHRLVYHSAMLR
jgi:hypothetical protein